MRDKNVQIGKIYAAKVTNDVVPVRIDSEHNIKGWNATNLKTGKKIRVKSGQKLRFECDADGGPVVSKENTMEDKGTEQQVIEEANSNAPIEPEHCYDHSEPEEPREWHPDVCGVDDCPGEPVCTSERVPLCQEHWDEFCQQPDGTSTEDWALAQEQPKPKKASKPRIKTSDNSSSPKTPKAPRASAINAAAEVLKGAAAPMGTKEMIALMAERGLWTSTNGKTPHATLHAAICREIKVKGPESRFVKADRGQFALAEGANQ